MNQVIRSFHHAQPTAHAVQLITPADFYRKLLAHDWYYAWSDDSSVYRAGQVAHALLVQLAHNAGPVQKWLLSEVSKHYSTGKAWGTERHPLPAPPTELTNKDAMKIRIELVKAELTTRLIGKFAAFLPASVKAHDPVQPVLEKVYLHGFYAGKAQPPALIGRHPKLRKAWEDGQFVIHDLAKTAN